MCRNLTLIVVSLDRFFDIFFFELILVLDYMKLHCDQRYNFTEQKCEKKSKENGPLLSHLRDMRQMKDKCRCFWRNINLTN